MTKPGLTLTPNVQKESKQQAFGFQDQSQLEERRRRAAERAQETRSEARINPGGPLCLHVRKEANI